MEIGSDTWKNIIIDGARDLNIKINTDQAEKFAVHARELLKWNQKINLTAITNPMEMAVKHFLDSIVPYGMLSGHISLLDMGSGAGFPGIPLKILKPALKMTLIDASRKKTHFQKHIISYLRLKNIFSYHIRIEELVSKVNRENQFDIIICRAFSSLGNFINWAMPLLGENGMLLALKGKSEKAQTEMASYLDSKQKTAVDNQETYFLKWEIKNYNLPFLGLERCLVMIQRG